MAAQRDLGLFAAETRGAQSSRATVEAGWPRWWLGMCSGSTSEQPDRLARGTRARTSRPAARPASRFLGGKSRTKSSTPENAYGFVDLIPRLYHHTKGSSWEHSGGRLERFLNTFRTEVVLLVISLTWHTTIASTLPRRSAPLLRGGARVHRDGKLARRLRLAGSREQR